MSQGSNATVQGLPSKRDRSVIVMLLLQNLITALEQLLANKLRSLLTVLGVIIAVTSTVVVVSVIDGFSGYVTTFLQGLGTNVMWVIPQRSIDDPYSLPAELGIDDIEEVAGTCDAIEKVAPFTEKRLVVRLADRETTVGVTGTTSEYLAIRNYRVDVGECFGPVDSDARNSVCVLGREVVDRLGANESIVGQYVTIDNKRFLVVGLLERKGSFLGESFDAVVLIPHTTFLKRYPIHGRFLAFMAQATKPESVAEAKAQLTDVLRRRHDLGPERENDFEVRAQDEILQEFKRLQWIGASVLVGIVGISLLVGGIGIMNVMLVSVTERTREIGLRKAVGARRRDILAQFLVEAVVLSVAGGTIGILIGYGIMYLVSLYPDMVDMAVPLWAALLGVGFSVFVGVVFGMIPAIKAAIIPPIDALRFE
ncbi:MAG: ABC transporter permease [Planctomycetota bacterium]